MKNIDPYKSLGVAKNASKDQIKKAYRELAKKYHPDKNKDKSAEGRFREVQEAYDILSDEKKRASFDQFGQAGLEGNGGFGSYGDAFAGQNFGDLGDLLGNFFGGFGFNEQRGGVNNSGSDIQQSITIEFLDAVFGVEKEISYRRYDKCNECSGSGAKNGKVKTCDECSGKGQVKRTQRTIMGSVQMLVTCPKCVGRGEIVVEKCNKCGGNGINQKTEELKIKIPAGVPDNVNFRFDQKGNAGANNGSFGDLYVEIRVKPHPRIKRKDSDMYLDQEIDLATAVLGGEISVITVKGDLKISVPKATQSGKVLKLTGFGGPLFKQPNLKGDQYVRLILKTPEKISKEEQKLWEQLASIKKK